MSGRSSTDPCRRIHRTGAGPTPPGDPPRCRPRPTPRRRCGPRLTPVPSPSSTPRLR